MTATESALLVAVPEADSFVDSWRQRLDPGFRLGVPAHITILFPFAPPDLIDDDLLTDVADVITCEPAFDYTLAEVRWFGDTVVYLAPEPDRPFRQLIQAVCRRFPDHEPYAGTIPVDDVVPHATIGDTAPIERMRAAEATVAPHLPIAARATEVWLMVGSQEPGSWRLSSRFPLGAGGL